MEKLSLLAPYFRLFQRRLGAPYRCAPPGNFPADPSLTLALVETQQEGQHYNESRVKLQNQLTADSSIYLSEAGGLSAAQQITSILNSSDDGLLNFQSCRVSGDVHHPVFQSKHNTVRSELLKKALNEGSCLLGYDVVRMGHRVTAHKDNSPEDNVSRNYSASALR